MRRPIEGCRNGGNGSEDIDDRYGAARSDDNRGRCGSQAAHGGYQDEDAFLRTRSASGAAKGARTAEGTMRSSPTSPTAVAPPSR